MVIVRNPFCEFVSCGHLIFRPEREPRDVYPRAGKR